MSARRPKAGDVFGPIPEFQICKTYRELISSFMRISVALLGVWPVCCRSSFPMNTVLFCWSFPHLLPIISVVCPDLFINCRPTHTSLPHSGLNLIPTAPLSPPIESLGRPWVGLFSRGDLLVKRGLGERRVGISFWQHSFTRSRPTPVMGRPCKAAGMSRGGRQTGLPTETER